MSRALCPPVPNVGREARWWTAPSTKEPLIDEDRRFVGMLSEADLSRFPSGEQLAKFVERVYA